jgi:phospholipid/cholesterol/gamma-HCH transport system ATP-binding protein
MKNNIFKTPQTAVETSSSVAEVAIEVRGLVKRFGAQSVLSGIDLDVYRGETICVLGRSGTGKSVLLKSIIALMDPDEGSVKVLGHCLHDLSERDRLLARRDLGYVFQGAALFDSLSVRENVGFPLAQQRLPNDLILGRVEEALQAVGLAAAMEKMPSELSGGMQKRVGLARAIVTRPQIILYDEPTTGLDPLTTDTINEIILRLQATLSVTSVVVTHDTRAALEVGDRLIFLDQGHIVAQGTPEEMMSSQDPFVRRFLGLELPPLRHSGGYSSSRL